MPLVGCDLSARAMSCIVSLIEPPKNIAYANHALKRTRSHGLDASSSVLAATTSPDSDAGHKTILSCFCRFMIKMERYSTSRVGLHIAFVVRESAHCGVVLVSKSSIGHYPVLLCDAFLLQRLSMHERKLS